ncbi:uncharacterized protein LOC110681182 [Aedes aegypti]|uniref:Uncharacterized protein n=1 Tax=Aedes aegypti TaxID=7159 RepID=A0A903VS59_AEDAE|nr:uncharacterized protein LOC110681182 [Aedes aegypti]
MALTPDELRKRIPQWSLESDGQLLQYMNQISKNLEAKCKQTQDNLTRLMLDIDESHLRYAQCFEQFQRHSAAEIRGEPCSGRRREFLLRSGGERGGGGKTAVWRSFPHGRGKSIANMYKSSRRSLFNWIVIG